MTELGSLFRSIEANLRVDAKIGEELCREWKSLPLGERAFQSVLAFLGCKGSALQKRVEDLKASLDQ